ncbi:IS4 family transposase [Alicyclobacillus sp. SP_1]|uniref:IS4 family transposase n=1 Tax=Alicyclobacillus sp. SP_1 TaxID=2942475 RepID=UPI00215728C7|nr:IS4 family transposase [Alicyclobacillus sp. SP_1]
METTLKFAGFRNNARKSEKDFTRERKVGFVPLVLLIFNMVRKSSQLEIDEFRERFMPESALATSYTKQSFSKARQKIRPEAFVTLNDVYIRTFYADHDYKTHKGFRMFAMDGCVLEVPNTAQTQRQYGYVTNKMKNFKLARALSSHLYDVENRLAVSTTIGRYDTNERVLAKANIEKMLTLIPETSPYETVVLFDRGYPSIEFIHYLMQRRVHFVMRVSTWFCKEIMQTQTMDEIAQLRITKERAKELRKQRTPVPEGTVLPIRVVKLPLSTGETELLITDLREDKLSQAEMGDIYFKRWGIETHFKALKYQFEVENFSGETPTAIEQDFHATTLLSNMASVIEQDALEEVQAQNSGRKYEEYKINHNILVGKLKNKLVEVILEDDDEKRSAIYRRLLHELTRNIVPVIKGRTHPRKTRPGANKYAKNKRRPL